MSVFDIGIATIFTREFLEAGVVVGQFRNVILKSPEYQEESRRIQALRVVRNATLWAVAFAIIVVVAVTVPLAILARELDDKVVETIEGVSKLVAAIAILQLSLKLPKWLGVYVSKKKDILVDGIPLSTIRFNVAWNIWREMAECGVFLIPYIVADEAKKIPVSAIVGIAIGSVLGFLIYLRSKTLGSKKWMAFFCAFVTGLLSVGLFVGGCHEFEEAYGETKKVWKIQGQFWNHKRFPMVFFKPFGYSSSRTVLQICAFWLWTGLTVACHLYKIWQTRRFNSEEMEPEEKPDHAGSNKTDTGSDEEKQ
jgi:high-affinity iron transporter